MKKVLVCMLVIVMAFIVGCSKNSSEGILDEISGVWGVQGEKGLFSIIYKDKKLSLLADDLAIPVTLGAIDNENKTVNLNVTSNDGKPGILTLRQIWDADKKSFHLQMTFHDGTQSNLTFVRKISTDDMNKIANAEAKRQSDAIGVAASVKPIEPTPSPEVAQPPIQATATNDLSTLRKEFAEADKEINNVYKMVMSNLSAGGKDELKREQKVWIKEKENKCNAENDEVKRLNCLIKMTNERADQIKTYSSN